MAIEKTLCAQKREGAGKGAAHRLRAQNLVPGVFYNSKGENVNVSVPSLPLEKLYFEIGNTTVFNLEIEDKGNKVTYPVFFWAVQKHPYKKRFTHIDYYGVDLEKEVKVEVPLEFTGTAKGVKLGGFLETYRETVLVAAKPLEMPHKIVIDVTDLGMNESLSVDKLKLPEGSHAIYDTNYTVVAVLEKTKEVAEFDAAEAAAAAAASAASTAAAAAAGTAAPAADAGAAKTAAAAPAADAAAAPKGGKAGK